MSWATRPAHARDLDAVLRLERAVQELPHWSRAAYAELLETRRDRPASLLLLVEDPSGAGVIGFAAAAFAAASLPTVELQSLVVAQAYRRKGIARVLCDEVIVWARASGGERLELEVRSASVGAYALYRSAGFAEAGRRPRYYAAPVDDAVLMSLDLAWRSFDRRRTRLLQE